MHWRAQLDKSEINGGEPDHLRTQQVPAFIYYKARKEAETAFKPPST